MHAIRQKCRPKHQVLVLKCYPRTTKGAVDVKPNSSELSYLLYYATTRRSKVQKVGAFLEKKTASDVWRARIGNVQVTLQILTALIEKAPRDLPLYAPYVLKILNIILRSSDITMVESSIITFESFCENHDGASLSADQGYLHQYEEIVHIYASFASTRPLPSKVPLSAPVAMRWRSVGLRAIKSVASAEALASVAGRQLNVTVPILLENLWTDNDDFLDLLEHRMKMEEKVDAEKSLTRRRTSIATVRTMENSADSTIMAVSGTTADADKLAEEDTGVLALQCLKGIFDVNNRLQIHGATQAFLKFVSERVAQNEPVTAADTKDGRCRGWGTRVFEMIAGWAPVQDRYVILVTAMDTLVRSPLVEANLKQQYVLATMIDSLLKSDINLIGLSVMDVLLGLIQHVLRALQLDGAAPHLQQDDVTGVKNVPGNPHSSSGPPGAIGEASIMPSDVRKHLLTRLQECIGDLATHVYYTDQISDMVSALLLRLKPSPVSGVPNAAAAIENPAAAAAAITEVGDMTEDQNTDGFFSFDTAKIKALEAIKSILIVASHRKSMSGVGNLGRSRVPVKVWEGTQWLLRDLNGGVRKAYVDALLSWLDLELIKSDLRISNDKHARTARDELPQNLSKRAVSNASHKEKPSKSSRTTFLQLLHLAVYENALQYLDSEPDIVLLHLLLTNLVENLGINAVKDGLPMIFRLQEEILELETPMAKIRIGSLCHGYFWALSEQFNFDSSPTGRVIHNEIRRRRSKKFWIDRIRLPALRIDQIGMPGQLMPQQALPLEEVESESLIPFDDRFQMVTLIALSYAQSVASPPPSAPSSPGRNFTHPILSADGPFMQNHHTMPEWIRDQMMSEWSRESVIAIVKESSKTVSLNGSRAGTNTTGHRNFLAVNGNLANREGTSSGQASPQSPHYPHHTHRSRPNSTYGLVGGLGVLQKLRVGPSSSPASESEHQSVTRVDQLKRILSGQQAASSGPIAITHSDASSESMVSYDFTASEVSFNQSPQFGPLMERSVSLREPRDRSRSKSRDRNGANELSRPLTSHPVLAHSNGNGLTEKEALDSVPPVPPLPSSLAHESVASQDYALKDTIRKGRSAKRNTNSRGQQSSSTAWGEEGAAIDLETLLKGIVTNGEEKGYFAKPPY